MRSRIAPTPSGFLHIGNMYSFSLTWLLTKKQPGNLLLRIDDMDGPRVREEYLKDIFDSLNFIGLIWELGPKNLDEFLQSFSQQLRLTDYQQMLDELVETGLVYTCTCSRTKLKEYSRNGSGYCPCREQNIALETTNAAWRIKLPENCTMEWKDEILGPISFNLSKTMGDFVVRRRDGLPAYQVCSLADDLFYDINLVVRGEDLLTSTAAQLYLASILDKTSFLKTRFYHHPLLKSDGGEKLSKSAGANSIKAFRENGGRPEALMQQIAAMPGIDIDNPVNDLSEMLTLFQQKHPPIY